MINRTKLAGARARTRAGRTEKISVSLDKGDLDALRRRAKKLYGGNLSAAIAEGARRIREQEGREALLAWLGPAADLTEDQRAAIHTEWRGDVRAAKGGSGARAGRRRRAS